MAGCSTSACGNVVLFLRNAKYRTFSIGRLPDNGTHRSPTLTYSQTTTMDNYSQALYALKRQKLAVERTLGASSNEECVVASRWVSAWQRVVQARLERNAAAAAASAPSRYIDHRSGRLLH